MMPYQKVGKNFHVCLFQRPFPKKAQANFYLTRQLLSMDPSFLIIKTVYFYEDSPESDHPFLRILSFLIYFSFLLYQDPLDQRTEGYKLWPNQLKQLFALFRPLFMKNLTPLSPGTQVKKKKVFKAKEFEDKSFKPTGKQDLAFLWAHDSGSYSFKFQTVSGLFSSPIFQQAKKTSYFLFVLGPLQPKERRIEVSSHSKKKIMALSGELFFSFLFFVHQGMLDPQDFKIQAVRRSEKTTAFRTFESNFQGDFALNDFFNVCSSWSIDLRL